MNEKKTAWDSWRCVRDAVLRDPSARWSATQRLVALAVADSMDGRTGEAEIGQRLIATRTGLDVKTVRGALAALTAPGALFVARPGGSPRGGKRARTVYRLSASQADRGHGVTGQSGDRGHSAPGTPGTVPPVPGAPVPHVGLSGRTQGEEGPPPRSEDGKDEHTAFIAELMKSLPKNNHIVGQIVVNARELLEAGFGSAEILGRVRSVWSATRNHREVRNALRSSVFERDQLDPPPSPPTPRANCSTCGKRPAYDGGGECAGCGKARIQTQLRRIVERSRGLPKPWDAEAGG